MSNGVYMIWIGLVFPKIFFVEFCGYYSPPIYNVRVQHES